VTGDAQDEPGAALTAWESIAADIAAEYPGWDVTHGLLGFEARRDGEVRRAGSQSGMRALLLSDAMASRRRQAAGERVHGTAGPGDDLSVEDLEREFPRWDMQKGTEGMWWYATRRETSPPVVVRGEDLTDLRDEIRRWIGTH
jgi:hypothetical protein